MPVRLHVLASTARHAASSSALVFRLVAFRLTPLLLHLSYFLAIDLLGFLALVLLRPSSPAAGAYRPRYVDVLFMSTSAVTVTGLATVEMEDLSASQLVVLTLLMLLGSEVFVSVLGLVLESSRQQRDQSRRRQDQDHDGRVIRPSSVTAAVRDEPDLEEAGNTSNSQAPPSSSEDSSGDGDNHKERCRAVRSLALVLSAYMAAVLVAGSVLVFAYVATVPTARDVLARKRLGAALFSVSATVSSFTNGGLLPTNESMAVFAANRGLLLLLAGQILAGCTLLPVFLRLAVGATRWVATAVSAGRGRHDEELEPVSVERSAAAAGFAHLLPSVPRAASLAATVVAVAAAAAALLCCMNWNSAVFAGLTPGEKVTNAVFMAVNVRQAGENSVDCSLVAPAVLVLFLAMMSVTSHAPPPRETINCTRRHTVRSLTDFACQPTTLSGASRRQRHCCPCTTAAATGRGAALEKQNARMGRRRREDCR
jgi:Trk-type K+ transport system membrane component